MATVKPFPAIRYKSKALRDLTCPPYDIISSAQRETFIARNPHNVIRLELPIEGDDPYEVANGLLSEWLSDGTMYMDEPGFYAYEMEFDLDDGETHKLLGLVASVQTEEFEDKIIIPHEETLSKDKADRKNLLRVTGCNMSSIYGLYEDNGIYEKLSLVTGEQPQVEFTDDLGIIHRVWGIYDAAMINEISRLFEDRKIYIADGHHRYETALEHWHEGGGRNTMMTLINIENPGLIVFPTHRIIKNMDVDIDGLIRSCPEFDVRRYHAPSKDTMEELMLSQLKAAFDVGHVAIAAYTGNNTYDLFSLTDMGAMEKALPDKSKAYRDLDVAVLHTLILERIGIDKENMANQSNLQYTRDFDEAIDMVDSGEASCSFIISTTKVGAIAQVAAAGERMPQKSTYFFPKLITGHLIHRVDKK